MDEPLLSEMGRFDREAQLRAARVLAHWKLRRQSASLRLVRADLDAIIADRTASLSDRLHALLCRRGVDHQLARYAAELNPQPQGATVNQIGPSVIRTVVPLLVGAVVSQLTLRGVDPGPYQDLIAQVVGVLVAAAYYGAVRLLETYVKPRLGLLLGSAKAPTYSAPAKPAPESPTGYVATEDSDVPESMPVEVEPYGGSVQVAKLYAPQKGGHWDGIRAWVGRAFR